jgi:hypothetical protein
MSNNVMDIFRTLVTAFHTPNQRATYAQSFSLTSGVPVLIDFRPLIAQGKMDNVQGIWIDNSAGTSSFTVQVLATGQNFTIPIGYQGSTILPMTADMQIVVMGSGTVPVVYTNFPLNTHSWPASIITTGLPATYAATFIVSETAPGVFFQLQGSATKLITIQQVIITGETTSTAIGSINISRTNEAITGGTTSAVSIGGYDINNAPNTATAKLWSTPGSQSGLVSILDAQLFLPATSSTSGLPFVFTQLSTAQGIIIRGANDFVQLNGGWATVPIIVVGTIIWTEE